jgi:hypothetical protein
MTTNPVDDYLQTRLPADQQQIAAELRSLVKQFAPKAEEVISRGSPAWQGRRLLAIISVSKTHLTLAFARGAEFTDDHGLLAGSGKTTRHLKLKSLDDLDRDALRDYLRQAVALDQGDS